MAVGYLAFLKRYLELVPNATPEESHRAWETEEKRLIFASRQHDEQHRRAHEAESARLAAAAAEAQRARDHEASERQRVRDSKEKRLIREGLKSIVHDEHLGDAAKIAAIEALSKSVSLTPVSSPVKRPPSSSTPASPPAAQPQPQQENELQEQLQQQRTALQAQLEQTQAEAAARQAAQQGEIEKLQAALASASSVTAVLPAVVQVPEANKAAAAEPTPTTSAAVADPVPVVAAKKNQVVPAAVTPATVASAAVPASRSAAPVATPAAVETAASTSSTSTGSETAASAAVKASDARRLVRDQAAEIQQLRLELAETVQSRVEVTMPAASGHGTEPAVLELRHGKHYHQDVNEFADEYKLDDTKRAQLLSYVKSIQPQVDAAAASARAQYLKDAASVSRGGNDDARIARQKQQIALLRAKLDARKRAQVAVSLDNGKEAMLTLKHAQHHSVDVNAFAHEHDLSDKKRVELLAYVEQLFRDASSSAQPSATASSSTAILPAGGITSSEPVGAGELTGGVGGGSVGTNANAADTGIPNVVGA